MPDRRQSWPYLGQAASPAALTQTPDGLLNSDRSLVGPLRRGTYGPVGPTGRGLGNVVNRAATDFGMDRVSPRPFDHIGQTYPNAPAPQSTRIRR